MKNITKVIALTLTLHGIPAMASESKVCEAKNYEMAVRYQHKSAEIMALQLQTYRFATKQFEEKIADMTKPENAAVVMDLDETVLDNSALFVKDLAHCHDYTRWDTWGGWEKNGKPTLIPGAKAFLDLVNKKHVKIYYVSDRSQKNKKDTLATLKSLGLPQVSAENVLLDYASKEKRRQHIQQTSKIIMLFGDSLADFASPFKTKKTTEKQRELVKENKFHFGDDWIILPNASYGTWSKD